MDFAALCFWGGMAALFAGALVLRFLEADRMAARNLARGASEGTMAAVPATRPARPELALYAPGVAALQRSHAVHRVRREGVEIVIWEGELRGDCVHALEARLDRPQCGDCIGCVNEALRWIESHAVAA